MHKNIYNLMCDPQSCKNIYFMIHFWVDFLVYVSFFEMLVHIHFG